MAADGTGWKEQTLVAHIQADTAVKKYGVFTIPYASSTHLHVELLYARVRHTDGTVVENPGIGCHGWTLPSAVTRQAPFYSDQKEWQLPIRSLRVGDTLEVKYRLVRTRADAPTASSGARKNFTSTVVVLAQSFELRVPASVSVNVWSPTVKPIESGSAATPAQHIYNAGVPRN